MLFSLGFHSRDSTLREFPRQITDTCNDIVPEDQNKLLTITGLCDYSAFAIRIFTLRHSDPLIEANPVKILLRINGIPYTDSQKRSRIIHEGYLEMVNLYNPAMFGYSIHNFDTLYLWVQFLSAVNAP